MKFGVQTAVAILAGLLVSLPAAQASTRKTHRPVFGELRTVPYPQASDPAGAAPGETKPKVRALVEDGTLKDWTTGDVHDVTYYSFVVQRALRINDALPGDKTVRWVWQRGLWLLVNRKTGHVKTLKLPDYNAAVSRPVWYRNYAAYCGVTSSGKSLYAIVAQVSVRKAVLAKKLGAYSAAEHAEPVCAAAQWQRDPMQVTFYPTGKNVLSYDLVPGSAVLVEDAAGNTKTPSAEKQTN